MTERRDRWLVCRGPKAWIFSRNDGYELSRTVRVIAVEIVVLAGIKGVFVDRDPTVLDRLFSEDYQQHNPQIPNGTAAIKALLGNLPADFRSEPGLVVAEGNYVTIHGRFRMGTETDGGCGYLPRRQWQDRRTLGCHAGRGAGGAKR